MRLTRICAALAVFAAACTPGPEPESKPPPHPFFPIGDGEVHALGKKVADGPIACASCHPPSQTNFAEFSCTGCHEHRQDVIDPIHLGLDGYRYASFGCYACHRDASLAHAPYRPKDARDPGRDLNLTALVPVFSGTTIATLAPLDQALPMPMNHDSDQVPQDLECGACHLDLELQTFYPGHFHAALLGQNLPQPTKCGSCHATTAPQGFVGDPALSMPSRDPPSGQMRHDAVLWANGAPTTTPAFDADCGVCHVTPVMSTAAFWRSSAVFHSALASHGLAEPASCLDCHANTRPEQVITLPTGVKFNHSGAVWLGDCKDCHASFQSWTGGVFHLPGAQPPPSCLPCHEGERPASGAAPQGPPFDYAGNALASHGGGQDCALCHASTSSFNPGDFGHGATTIAANTCAACHTSQRPTMPVTFDGGTFDHSIQGAGDCVGCHQATTSHTSLSDWAGGQGYPGASLISSTDQFLDGVVETTLKHGTNGLVTGTSTITARLFNSMLHTSAQIPPGLDAGLNPTDYNNPCFHCHTNTAGTVTSFANGQFHSTLTALTLPQPAQCDDCHAKMRPPGIVGVSDLHPMDHSAQFAATVNVGGQMISSVNQLDCASCHSSPGGSWDAGAFHSVVGTTAAQQADCTGCHYLLMADGGVSDFTAANGDKMAHRSVQVTVQKCDTCHVTALSHTTNLTPSAFSGGTFHDWVSPQPSACIDCHSARAPAMPTQSEVAYQGDRQWMNHQAGAVKAKDCAACHLGDASSTVTTFDAGTALHAHLSPGACAVCHGPNAPASVRDSSTVTSSTASGAAGTHDQIDHTDLNVTGHDCNFCHTQVGPGSGNEWAQAKLHANFTGGSSLVTNGTTGRCSHCHIANKPDSSFTAQNHTAFTQSTGTDCAQCHSWPGAGTVTTPDWKKPPQPLNLGGFNVPSPPGDGGVEPGVNGVFHPAATNCTGCHQTSAGGRGAFGYDHSGAPSVSCAACHEAGSDLVGSPWTLNASGATMVSATCGQGSGTIADRGGDTRPIGISGLACVASNCNAACQANHFYPADCGECHGKPAASPALVQTGSAYASAWAFKHFFGAPAQQTTCAFCHG